MIRNYNKFLGCEQEKLHEILPPAPDFHAYEINYSLALKKLENSSSFIRACEAIRDIKERFHCWINLNQVRSRKLGALIASLPV